MDDIGDKLAELARSMKFPRDKRARDGRPDEEMSVARAKGWPEWMWDGHEQSEECRRRQYKLAKSQCRSGEAIQESELYRSAVLEEIAKEE